MNKLVFLIICTLTFSCTSEQTETDLPIKMVTMPETDYSQDEEIIINETPPEYSSEVYFTDGKGWGYKILMDNKPYINQPHIPAISGNKGFSDEEKAQITADFAISKIKNGVMPPTISEVELDSLGVLD
jgi:hypothetical protein